MGRLSKQRRAYLRSDEAAEYRKLYSRKAWKELRMSVLLDQPLCEYCLLVGRTTSATLVDHIEPHKGDLKLFFDRTNLASCCDQCHSGFKQRFEETGDGKLGFDLEGYPIEFNIADFRAAIARRLDEN